MTNPAVKFQERTRERDRAAAAAKETSRTASHSFDACPVSGLSSLREAT
jgi:hypothetical protein